MKYKMYKMKFQSPIHLGKQSLEDGEYAFCADTLFSALCQEAVCMGESALQEFYLYVKKGELLLSDAFPFMEDTYYLPKPIKQIETEGKQGDSKLKKAYKKLRYIPMEAITDYLHGCFDVSKGQGLEELGKFEMKVLASIRGEEKTLPYRVGTYYYKEGNGLYFIIGYRDDQTVNLFEQLLKCLSFSGIGGKRASGMGRFNYFSEEIPIDFLRRLENNGKEYMSLSVSLPRDEELDEVLQDAEYLLCKRSGFVASENYAEQQMRKRDLYVLKTGSCFKTKYEGDVYDVSGKVGSHPVYRYAKPIFMEVDA